MTQALCPRYVGLSADHGAIADVAALRRWAKRRRRALSAFRLWLILE
jgi:hypothetical protein